MEGVILNADCLVALKAMPDACVDMVMTSPPYWRLRDYRVEGQLGLESTLQEYVAKLCDVFEEVKRVLKPTGTCWVNLGDKYSRGSLCQIPARFAIEMENRGWILPGEIVWHKPNCTPSSGKRRFTVDFEKMFFFAKSRDYFFEQQLEPLAAATKTRAKYGWKCDRANNRNGVQVEKMGEWFCPTRGRNKRCVWTISTKGSKGAHFATYPPDLCVTPIKAGCPEFICVACGTPRQILREKLLNISQADRIERKKRKKCGNRLHEVNTVASGDLIEQYKVVGWTNCGCNRGFRSGIVLDPFAGAGTTLVVAKELGRQYVGIELNPEYCRIIEERLKGVAPLPSTIETPEFHTRNLVPEEGSEAVAA